MGAAGAPPGEDGAAADWRRSPGFAALSAELASGRLSLDRPAGRLRYGSALIGQMLRGCRGPAHRRALAVVGGRAGG